MTEGGRAVSGREGALGAGARSPARGGANWGPPGGGTGLRLSAGSRDGDDGGAWPGRGTTGATRPVPGVRGENCGGAAIPGRGSGAIGAGRAGPDGPADGIGRNAGRAPPFGRKAGLGAFGKGWAASERGSAGLVVAGLRDKVAGWLGRGVIAAAARGFGRPARAKGVGATCASDVLTLTCDNSLSVTRKVDWCTGAAWANAVVGITVAAARLRNRASVAPAGWR